MNQIRSAAASLNQSADQQTLKGGGRISKSWQDLYQFVNDGIRFGASIALTNLIQKQLGMGKPQPAHNESKAKNYGVELNQ